MILRRITLNVHEPARKITLKKLKSRIIINFLLKIKNIAYLRFKNQRNCVDCIEISGVTTEPLGVVLLILKHGPITVAYHVIKSLIWVVSRQMKKYIRLG